MTIRHYASIYRQYLAVNVARAMAFRAHFVMLILLDVFFYSSTLLTIDLTFRQVGPLFGWSRQHFLFFGSFMLAVDQLHMSLVSESFWIFSEEVRTGALDFTLLRPANAVFICFFRFIRAGSFGLILIPWALLIYYGRLVGLSNLSWACLPFAVFLTAALRSSLEILLMTLSFWLVESTGLNFLRMQLQDVSRWPDFLYQDFFRRIFTFLVPVLLASSYPVHFLFDNQRWGGILICLGAELTLVALISVTWRLGRRRYESGSS